LPDPSQRQYHTSCLNPSSIQATSFPTAPLLECFLHPVVLPLLFWAKHHITGTQCCKVSRKGFVVAW
jgi:hypothetical protein